MDVRFEGVSHVYGAGTPFARPALSSVTVSIAAGSVVALLGRSGSGKTTFAQLAAGLERPTAGRVFVGGAESSAERRLPPDVRRRIGAVLQHPEHQLFEETVGRDVGFALRRRGVPPDEVERRVRATLLSVGLDPEAYFARSPFRLSGGEKRRAAIAGVLVYEPELVVFDEPTAGLDPEARERLIEHLEAVFRRRRPTVLYVTHRIDEAIRLADRVLLFDAGRLAADVTPAELLRRFEEYRRFGLRPSPFVRALFAVGRRAPDVWDDPPRTPAALADWLAARLGGERKEARP
ncbi:MAG: ATP-binding cassette domain-containing protein [Hydrogenibacillus schlegelii]|nr:ATP-binding cassette domain-containing protein [Hydrogenibacillus schlegelii]